MLIINKWTGRLGNNIQQLVVCICFAKYFGHNIIKFPNHKFFLGNSLTLNIEEKDNSNIYDDFFYIEKLNKKYGIPFDFINQKLPLECLNKIFKIKSNIKINENDLLIHIRSGDIFSNNPHSGFVPPNFSFYKKIITLKKWNNIYLLAEDTKNPVINKLIQNFDVKIKLQSLEEDINMIIRSKNICFGVGTFIPSLLLFNNHIENIYYPTYCHRNMINYIECNKFTIDIKNYIKKGEWKNTHEQRMLLVKE